MATTKEDRDFILERLGLLDGVTCRPMMGEYLLYLDGLLFGGIYDSRLLVKRTETNRKYNLAEAIPYKGAKLMYHLENLDDQEELRAIILDTCAGLPVKK